MSHTQYGYIAAIILVVITFVGSIHASTWSTVKQSDTNKEEPAPQAIPVNIIVQAPVPIIVEKETPPQAAPEYKKSASPLMVFGSIPYWDQASAVSSFERHVADIDAISLFWYRLGADGSIEKYKYAKEDQSIITFAHDNNVKVLGLIANLPESGGWDSGRVEKVIGSPDARKAHIAEILSLVESKNLDGVDIDYEFLDDSQTEDFTALINELGAALHAKAKILRVAIHPQRKGSETRGQDVASLTGADYLSFMTYDEHWETSRPGPMASIPWIREVLEHARRGGVPMKKVLLGIPLDAYDWPEDRGGWEEADGLTYEEVVALANRENVEIHFDEDAEAPYFRYEDDGGTLHEVWFENVTSFQPKYELAKEFGVGGIALWRFGKEDMRIYEVIEAQ